MEYLGPAIIGLAFTLFSWALLDRFVGRRAAWLGGVSSGGVAFGLFVLSGPVMGLM